MSTNPITKRQKTPYAVWIIPVIALAIAGWLYYKHQQERGVDITVVLDSLEGIEVDKTKLMYRGFELGVVTNADINPENILQGIVTINVPPPADKFITREGMQFYKVEPKVGVSGISGLGTLLSGSFIRLYPPDSNALKTIQRPFQNYFIASKEEPIDMINPGRYIFLESQEALAFGGTPILYKGFVVGELLESKMVNDRMTYVGLIDAPYIHLVKKNSRFWVSSSVDFHASLAGVRLKVDSLAKIITGGISFNSPEYGEVMSEDYEVPFDLLPSEESLSLDSRVITLKGSRGFNLDPELNSVYYRGVKAGKIISVNYNPRLDETAIRVQVKHSYVPLINDNAHFWIVEPKIGLKGIEGLDAIPSGAYLTFDSAIGGESKDTFPLHETPPPRKGLTYILTSNDVGTLKVGAPVSMKGVEMGIVTDIRFSEDMMQTIVKVLIDAQFDRHVNRSTAFYLQQAFEVDAGFDGISVNTGSLEQLLVGGIAFETFDRQAGPSNLRFTLYADRKELESDRYLQSGGKRFTLTSQSSESLEKGSVVYYREFPAGKVLESRFNPKSDRIEIDIYIEPTFTDRIDSNTLFFEKSGIEVGASLSGVDVDIAALDGILQGSLAFKSIPGGKAVDSGHRFMLHEDLYHAENNFVDVILTMPHALGTRQGSPVKYKGLQIGQLDYQVLRQEHLETHLIIDEQYASLLKKDTFFWVEPFQADLGGIKNPGTVLTGTEIHLMPGRSQSFSNVFTLSESAPPPTYGKDGLRILINGSRRSSLDVGSPVFYRQVQVGQIESYRLSQDGNGVDFTLFIDPCYQALIRENSVVYLPSAIGVDVSLLGAKLRTETIETMVSGGIGIINPEDLAPQANDGRRFTLQNDVEEEWYSWKPAYAIDLQCSPEGVL